MRRVVSVSLGSSRRDHAVELELCGERFRIERRGTDGSVDRAKQMIADLDGRVDAIGLGGIDLYLVAGARRYMVRQAKGLARAAKVTPIVDGSGLKNTLERETIRILNEQPEFRFAGRSVLLVSAVDRFGMAEAFVQTGAKTTFGDFLFALGLPIPMHSLVTVRVAAAVLLPILCQMPISFLYPTGEEQERSVPRGRHYFDAAEVIAGDFHFIRRYMPASLTCKMIITNTVTTQDAQDLRSRGVGILVTTTPEFQGRSFGTNVMEGIVVALARKQPADMCKEDYIVWLRRLGWQPRVERLTAGNKCRVSGDEDRQKGQM